MGGLEVNKKIGKMVPGVVYVGDDDVNTMKVAGNMSTAPLASMPSHKTNLNDEGGTFQFIQN